MFISKYRRGSTQLVLPAVLFASLSLLLAGCTGLESYSSSSESFFPGLHSGKEPPLSDSDLAFLGLSSGSENFQNNFDDEEMGEEESSRSDVLETDPRHLTEKSDKNSQIQTSSVIVEPIPFAIITGPASVEKNHLEKSLSSSPLVTETSAPLTKSIENEGVWGDLEIIWPVSGKLTSLFGIRHLKKKTRMHAGIDIAAPVGTPVHASAAGRVIFAGRKKGYGYAVIIAHNDTYSTLYAHLKKILVRTGQKVPRNRVVGYVGKTGRVTGANLHYETRIDGVPQDPLILLPPGPYGVVRKGMNTPSFTDQLAYYDGRKKYAFHDKPAGSSRHENYN